MRSAIENAANEVYLSPVSIWEAIIKHQIGKLPLPHPPEIYLPLQRKNHSISSLPLDESSIVQLGQLPPIHRDPFDRILICQAIRHNLTLVTVDHAFPSYQVSLFK